MYEQLNMFSFLEDAPQKIFSWDDDINEIHRRLCDLSIKYGLDISGESWKVWEHAKEYGYRMSFHLKVTREIAKNESFFKDIEGIVEFAKTKNIDLSPMYNAVFFFSGENTATLTFFTDFLDKQRRQRKSW